MKCKLCSHEAPHPRAISDHWKIAHPSEFKKKQKAKKAAAAPVVEETPVDCEAETMLALIATIEVLDDQGECLHDYEARGRILRYVADRVGVKLASAEAA